MVVKKYKPKGTPHHLQSKVESTVSEAAKAVGSAKAAIARSKKIVRDSREMVRIIALKRI